MDLGIKFVVITGFPGAGKSSLASQKNIKINIKDKNASTLST